MRRSPRIERGLLTFGRKRKCPTSTISFLKHTPPGNCLNLSARRSCSKLQRRRKPSPHRGADRLLFPTKVSSTEYALQFADGPRGSSSERGRFCWRRCRLTGRPRGYGAIAEIRRWHSPDC